MIELIDVTIRRGANAIASGLDLRIEPGRVFWVIGPNGAGKSSLLRVLVGMDTPRAGTVRRAFPEFQRLLYFHSEMAVPSAASVRAWERLVDRLMGPVSRGRTRLWPDVRSSARFSRLSTGERKRLLLDALLRREAPMVLDEPFEHLSPEAKATLRDLLRQRARRYLVVVATNQATGGAEREGGLHLEAGRVTRLPTPTPS